MKAEFKTEVDTAKTTEQSDITLLKAQVAANKAAIEASKKEFKINFMWAKSYLTKPLTGNTLSAVNAIISTKDTAMKALQASTNLLIASWTVDRSGYMTQAEEILTSFRTALLPYVATEKATAFDTFIQSKVNLMISNVGIRQTNASIKMQIGTRKASFKERVNAKKVEHKALIKSMRDSEKASQ